MRNDHLPIYTHLCDDPLPNSLQLKRATARNWRTGKFEHVNYRISKRYILLISNSQYQGAIPSEKSRTKRFQSLSLVFCWFQLNRATVHDVHGNLIHANYRISKRYRQANLEWLFVYPLFILYTVTYMYYNINVMYCIVGNFRGRKLSRISRFYSHMRKFSPRNFGHATLIYAISLIFHEMLPSYQSVKVFSLKSFPLCGMCVHVCYPWHACV